MLFLIKIILFSIFIKSIYQQTNNKTHLIINLDSGHWLEVPNSNIRSIVPNPEPPGYTGVRSVIDAWCGGAYDTKRDNLYIWGGGHADYSGNEVYSFSMDDLKWERIWGPTPNQQIPDDGTHEIYGDGNPGSRHTYFNLVYVPTVDGMFSEGGALWKRFGSGCTDKTWWFDLRPVNPTWIEGARTPGWYSCVGQSEYDTLTQTIYRQCRTGLINYKPKTNDWEPIAETNGGFWNDVSFSIDVKRRKLYYIGGCDFISYDLNQTVTDYGVWVDVPKLGDHEITCTKAPGFVYDPVRDKIIAWGTSASNNVDSSSLYILDLDTQTWSKITTKGKKSCSLDLIVEKNKKGAKPTDQVDNGTYNRFRYSPNYDAYILVNSVDENVFIYKPDDWQGIIEKNNRKEKVRLVLTWIFIGVFSFFIIIYLITGIVFIFVYSFKKQGKDVLLKDKV